MPSVLVLSLEGFCFSSRQLYEQLLPKLLSRASVHESLTIKDALNYVRSGWPTHILITDSVITAANNDSERLLDAVVEYTRHGCTTVLMGFFAVDVDSSRLDLVFEKYFDLRWRVAEATDHEPRLLTIDESMIRMASLVPQFNAKALYLGRVSTAHTIYAASTGATMLTYAAYGRVGLGKLGYIGDWNFGEEAERLIVAMCHLDRPEDSLAPITICPSKSALVIVDMQNFFLSALYGREQGNGHTACSELITHAIPAARKAGIRIVWLNWGLTEQDIQEMPPAVTRAFGFFGVSGGEEVVFEERERNISVDGLGQTGMGGPSYGGLGAPCGDVVLEDGTTVDAGRLLMKHTWNASLYPPLDSMYKDGRRLESKPDVWIHKNRMSGMWGGKTECEEFLEKEGIRTLFLAGVNTDQCVGGTLTDAFSKGYDCVLLNDGCGTTSPQHAQECWESNAAYVYGFCTSCEEFAQGVNAMEKRVL
ncbi:Isochorismatase-like protein [Massariosphaeria phaeospora]|uniref:Isochorismatase-like protein n=1 Tax=Massariosphaeria phaeospora TaxID=100035 RepID=A0A7C8MF42_9PLEO|nr:Isochorismatase-like protein [Massariosphaeria phaeospora]